MYNLEFTQDAHLIYIYYNIYYNCARYARTRSVSFERCRWLNLSQGDEALVQEP